MERGEGSKAFKRAGQAKIDMKAVCNRDVAGLGIGRGEALD